MYGKLMRNEIVLKYFLLQKEKHWFQNWQKNPKITQIETKEIKNAKMKLKCIGLWNWVVSVSDFKWTKTLKNI